MSLYEALSLVVSSMGTLGTVYIGLRQLRPSAPTPAYPAPATTYPAPGPYGHPAPYGPAQQPPPPARPRRPSTVTAAALVLFVAASAHPVAVVLYYALRFATEAGAAAEELSGEGIVDVLVFGGVAFLSALLGVFVARGSRVALWFVWVLGAVSVLALCALGGLAALAMLAPDADRPAGFDLLFLGYFAFVLVAYAVGAGLLAAAASRSYYRRP